MYMCTGGNTYWVMLSVSFVSCKKTSSGRVPDISIKARASGKTLRRSLVLVMVIVFGVDIVDFVTMISYADGDCCSQLQRVLVVDAPSCRWSLPQELLPTLALMPGTVNAQAQGCSTPLLSSGSTVFCISSHTVAWS